MVFTVVKNSGRKTPLSDLQIIVNSGLHFPEEVLSALYKSRNWLSTYLPDSWLWRIVSFQWLSEAAIQGPIRKDPQGAVCTWRSHCTILESSHRTPNVFECSSWNKSGSSVEVLANLWPCPYMAPSLTVILSYSLNWYKTYFRFRRASTVCLPWVPFYLSSLS